VSAEAKSRLRRRILNARAAVPKEARLEAESRVSSIILEHLKGACVACYRALPGELSVDMAWMDLARQGVDVCFPRVVGEGALEFARHLDGFRTGKFGVSEPIGETVSYESIDAVLVPGLAFNLNGTRLGFGGGYYDRALAKMSAFRVGVCYDWQVLHRIPTEPWDEAVHAVASDRRFYSTEKFDS